MAVWSQHRTASPSPQRTLGHLRSLSAMGSSNPPSRSRSPAKSFSSGTTPQIEVTEVLKSAATLTPSPVPKRMTSTQSLREDEDHNTIPDPRRRVPTPASGDSPNSNHHPDLDQEVAALSTKLINAINHQTTLDDTLSATRQELESSKERVRELEALVARQQETLSGDVWIKKKSVEVEKSKLLHRIVDEKRQREEVEKEKRKIEQELETLTVSLFEEANKMVITAKEDAKKEHDVLQRKNDQLRAQLTDTEGLMKSQQEQLAQLKLVIEQMSADRDDHSGTAPSSPGFSKFDSRDDDTEISEANSQSGTPEPFTPTYPTNLPHIVHPVLRNDLTSYEDFLLLIQTSKRNSARVSSGSYGSIPLLNFNGNVVVGTTSNPSTAPSSVAGTPASTTVSPQTPNTPASAISATPSTPLPPLKESKFYKRVLAEDIEPTLRLDIAPGLSWLARRSVLSAMTEGSLVVEPIPSNGPFASISKPQFYPCSLCGEARKDESHLRNHRFRTSESDSAQRYPLCQYCLSRVRSTCDFLGFLRMVKDGHWRADTSDTERTAWEESVRLRDQMFWSRIGGGVVPVIAPCEKPTHTGSEKARASTEDDKATQEVSQPLKESSDTGATPRAGERSDEVIVTPDVVPAEAIGDTAKEQSDETAEVPKDHRERLSLTIPGSFDDISP